MLTLYNIIYYNIIKRDEAECKNKSVNETSNSIKRGKVFFLSAKVSASQKGHCFKELARFIYYPKIDSLT